MKRQDTKLESVGVEFVKNLSRAKDWERLEKAINFLLWIKNLKI